MKILMVTMAMDIGGAETHILELSRELKKRGLDITVASNGGAYEKELASAGIPHVKVPCHSKNPACMTESYKILKKLILTEKYDIVHAHARIPAFICDKLYRKYRFRFVTTAHWVFNPGFPYNYLTQWGEKSLAVSEDIKDYLVQNYGIDPENVRITINGIDLEKFSKNTDWSDIEQEFSLDRAKTRIVYISRMDEDRSYAAHRLIEITPEIISAFPDTEIVIVGGGNDFEAVSREAQAVNEKLGKRVLILTDSRTDINHFTASADLFIGVSRAALEAMACEKPCIIAGNEGYIGIFDEDKLQISFDTNFCCRGCEETTSKALLRDVLTVLNATPEEKERLGKIARDTVKEHYSMNTMANDAMKLYVSAIKKKGVNDVDESEFADIASYLRFNPLSARKIRSDVLISGYYGFSNMGDDSILQTVIAKLQETAPGIRVTALTKDPKTDEKTFGIPCINRVNPFAIVNEMRHSRLLISGGGSLFQDSTSKKSLRYYALIVNTAKRLGMKTYVYANGVGVIHSQKNKDLTRDTVNKCDLVTVRDQQSVEELISIGVDRKMITLTADPAFMMDPVEDIEIEKQISATIGEKKKYFIITLRRFEGLQKLSYDEKTLLNQIVPACAKIASEYDMIPLFVSMQPNLDLAISKEAQAILKKNHKIPSVVYTPKTVRELMTVIKGGEILSGAAFVCSMRLHTLIYASTVSVPIIGLSLDPKIDAFTTLFHNTSLFRVPETNEEQLYRAFRNTVEQNDAIREEMQRETEKFRCMAERDIDNVIELLGK